MGFAFKDRFLTVNIEGVDYTLTHADEAKKAFDNLNDELAKLAKEKNTAEALKVCGKLVDTLFGTGADKKIFAKRKRSLLDYTDLFLFITDEVKKTG